VTLVPYITAVLAFSVQGTDVVIAFTVIGVGGLICSDALCISNVAGNTPDISGLAGAQCQVWFTGRLRMRLPLT
jgi:hypothetical protein